MAIEVVALRAVEGTIVEKTVGPPIRIMTRDTAAAAIPPLAGGLLPGNRLKCVSVQAPSGGDDHFLLRKRFTSAPRGSTPVSPRTWA